MKQRFLPLVAVVALLAAPASLPAEVMVNNLDAPSPGYPDTLYAWWGFAGEGVGMCFRTGTEWSRLDSVTLEHVDYQGPSDYFHLQILEHGTTMPFPYIHPDTFCGELGKATIDPRPTMWPGMTVFVNYTPDTTILLAPNTYYLVAATVPIDIPSLGTFLALGISQSYTVGEDWEVRSIISQWQLTPPNTGWSRDGLDGFLKVELNATIVPEPGTGALVLGFSLLAAAARRKRCANV